MNFRSIVEVFFTMKYKCVRNYIYKGKTLINEGDIVVIEGNTLYNITTSVDYRNVSDIDNVMSCLETLTDDTIPNVGIKYLLNELDQTYTAKNHDYGNSFEQSLNEEGLAASRIRLGDKWNRFKFLSKNGTSKVTSESLRDTLLDMANYCIMTVAWLDKLK